MFVEATHRPVMLGEAVSALAIRPDGFYVDCTFGQGGHAQAIMERLGREGRLLAIDRDREAVESSAARRMRSDPRFQIEHGRFSDLHHFVSERGWSGRIAGVLMDLGVSSPQLDIAERGFSFLRDGPLDMRMDTSQKWSAADWLAKVSERELTRVLREYGEERFAGRIARLVVEERRRVPIVTTRQLVRLIEKAIPVEDRHKHPATRTFQAIRIVVNDELGELARGLKAAVEVLMVTGRLVVIAFHSLEDRIVKRFFRDEERGGACGSKPPGDALGRLRRLGRAVRASEEEIRMNPRARSAVLRVAEKIAA